MLCYIRILSSYFVHLPNARMHSCSATSGYLVATSFTKYPDVEYRCLVHGFSVGFNYVWITPTRHYIERSLSIFPRIVFFACTITRAYSTPRCKLPKTFSFRLAGPRIYTWLCALFFSSGETPTGNQSPFRGSPIKSAPKS